MFDMHEANNAETDDFNLYTDAAEQSIKDD
jgi:hypothetical protein